jgi:hypothetical protein
VPWATGWATLATPRWQKIADQARLGLRWTQQQVHGAKCVFWESTDLFDIARQVHGPTVHFTLLNFLS